MELTLDNYYSQEANMEYMSVSQFKDFLKCEKYGLAKVKGEYVQPKTESMLIGLYVDAYFSNRLEQLIDETPELLDSRSKEKKVKQGIVKQAEECIRAIVNDDFFMSKISGLKQFIATGEINGVKFKGAIDFLNDDINDLKVVESISEKSWVKKNGKKQLMDFIKAYDYDIQGAVYQELVKQMLALIKNFNLACVSKEENPDKAIINLPQSMLDKALQLVKDLAPRFDLIKKGLIEPIGCGNCVVCRKYNRLNRVVSYDELFGENDYANN